MQPNQVHARNNYVAHNVHNTHTNCSNDTYYVIWWLCPTIRDPVLAVLSCYFIFCRFFVRLTGAKQIAVWRRRRRTFARSLPNRCLVLYPPFQLSLGSCIRSLNGLESSPFKKAHQPSAAATTHGPTLVSHLSRYLSFPLSCRIVGRHWERPISWI